MSTEGREQANHNGVPMVVGLTGGIASGKSTVSGMLATRGAHVIDADTVGHQVIMPDGEAYPEVVAEFGSDILDDAGTISRPKLGALVFSSKENLARLNAISHPRMAERMAREIATVRAREPEARPPLIVLDAAILYEAGWDALCSEVWAVETPEDLSVVRLMERNNMPEDQARARLAAQIGNAERARRAQRIITNVGSLADLEARVQALWETVC